MLGWKYNFMINSMQFYSINAKKAKVGGAVIVGYFLFELALSA